MKCNAFSNKPSLIYEGNENAKNKRDRVSKLKSNLKIKCAIINRFYQVKYMYFNLAWSSTPLASTEFKLVQIEKGDNLNWGSWLLVEHTFS